MKVQNDIDFTTLNWVKQELDETLKQSRQALEAYVEDTADKSQMRFCASYLHQVQGTLRMVELYGAAMVVEEMERLALGVLEGEIRQTEDAYAVLMRGMVQMPDYLERLQSGHRDIPIVLLPLLNDLRACRGEKLLTETALFSPDLSLPLPVSAAGPGQPLAPELLKVHSAKLRLAYQFGLLKWFKGEDVDGNLSRLVTVLDRLRSMTAQVDGRRLWFVAGGVLEGVQTKAVEASVAVKLLFGKVDREIKHLVDAGERGLAQQPPLDLAKGLLYYAAHARVGNRRIDELKQIYSLSSLLPSDKELEHAKGALSGHNRALLDTVGQNIKDDLLRVKDALDLFLRNPDGNVADMAGQAETLHRVGDTLGMLGLGVPRRVVLEQREVLDAVAAGRKSPEEQVLLDVAGSLLYVESSLDDYIERLGQGQTQDAATLSTLELPAAEVRRILDATMKEASVNIQQAKQDIVAFIESPWEHARIEQIPRLMEEIGGALRMLNLAEPASLIDGVIRFTEVELLKHRRVPTADQLDLLADAMASIEYYLEAVRETRPNRDKILDVTRRSLESLGYWPVPSVEEAEKAALARLEAASAPQPQFPSFDGEFTTARTEIAAVPELSLEQSVDTSLHLTVDLPDVADLSLDPAPAASAAEPEMRSAVEIAPGDGLDNLMIGEIDPQPVDPAATDTLGLDIGNFEVEPRHAPTEHTGESLAVIDMGDADSAFVVAPEEPPVATPVAVEETLAFAFLDEPPRAPEAPPADSTFSWIEELAKQPEPEAAPVVEPVVELPAFAFEPEPPAPAPVVAAPAPAPAPVVAAPTPAPAPAAPVAAPAPAPAPVIAPPPAIELPASGFSAVPSDEIDDEIREVFVEEVQDVLNDLNRQYPTWKNDANDFEKLKPVRRSFHTLKGSGRLVGALAIGEFSWKIENMLNRVLDKSIAITPAVFDLLDQSIAALPQLLAALRGEGTPTANIGGLMWVADKVGAGEEVFLPKNEPAALVPTAEPAVDEVPAGELESSSAVGNADLLADGLGPVDVSSSAEAPTAAHDASVPESAGESALAEGRITLADVPDALAASAPESQVDASQLDTWQVDKPQLGTETPPQQTLEVQSAVEKAEMVAADERDLPASLALDPMLSEILRSEAETHDTAIRGWLEQARRTGQPLGVSDELLRAVHTLNGAVSMVDLPVLSQVMAPLEAYLKRLRSKNEAPNARGVHAIEETSTLIRRVMEAVEHGGGLHHVHSEELALEIQRLRDDLPDHEPSLAVLTGAISATELQDLVDAGADAENDALIEGSDADNDAIAVIDMGDFEESRPVATEEVGEVAARPWWEAEDGELESELHPHADELAAVQSELDSLFGEPLTPAGSDETPSVEQRIEALLVEQEPVAAPAPVVAPAADMTAESASNGEEIAALAEIDALFDADPEVDAAAAASDSTAAIDPATELDSLAGLDVLFAEPAAGEGSQAAVDESLWSVSTDPGLDPTADDAAAAELEALFGPADEPAMSEPAAEESALTSDFSAFSSADNERVSAFGESSTAPAAAADEIAHLDDLDALFEATEAVELGASVEPGPDLDGFQSIAFDELPATRSQDVTLTGNVEPSAPTDDAVEDTAFLREAHTAVLPEDDELIDLGQAEAVDLEALFATPAEPSADAPGDDLDVLADTAREGEAPLAAVRDDAFPESESAIIAAETEHSLEQAQDVPVPVLDAPHVPAGALLSAAAALALDRDPEGPLNLPDLDADLLEIFVQEGGDILDQSDGMMARLREEPENREIVVGLQRELHTLKGGARMAGLAPIGDLSHAMESLFEAVVDGRAKNSPLTIEALERAFDRLHGMVQKVGRGQAIGTPDHTIARLEALTDGREAELLAAQAAASAAAAAPAQSAAASVDAGTPAAVSSAAVETPDAAANPAVQPAAPTAPARRERTALDDADDQARQQQEVVRVRADLLDNLVNYAGEVSIYRSRLEAQIGGFRFNLQEFEQTVTRLRDQLRKLEIETEAQIIARFQRESESANKGGDFDPLELDRFSTLQQLSRALAESVSDLVSLQGLMDDIARQSETLLLQQSRVSSDLQEGLMRTRMVPFDSLVPRLRRIIRQTASELGKKAQLKVEGAQGEMDRTVLERMTAPLEHMLRNALAHGLERPEFRRSHGKNEEGTITINVSREATEVVIKVSDDGGGMNRDAIRRKAIERKLIAENAQLSDRDLFQFILEAGFSTAEQVSKIAGRGVGMDVVNSEIRQLGGTLAIDSEYGKGSTFTIRLPFTLSVTQAILVRLGEHIYAVPMSSVAGVIRMPRKELDARLARHDMEVSYASEKFQLYDLGDLLGARINHPADETQAPILMTRTGDQRAAIRVTGVIGSKEVVVKSMGLQLASVPGFFGATIMGDGSVVVILDLAPLVRHGVAVRSAPDLARELDLLPEEPVAPVRKQPLVMVVDDSITMRKVTTRVLERNDLEVMTAKDGLDAVEQLQDRIPDLMLLDIEMPRMDGYELATYVRNDSRLKQIPIIMITSRTGEKHRQRAMEIGVDRYLGKPYQETDLLKNVQEALSHGRNTQPAH